MAILDGLKDQWNKMQATIEEKRRARDAQDMKSLKHDKVPLQEQKAPAREQSPVERISPIMAEKAKQAEQQRQPAPAPAPQTEAVPTKLDHKPENKTMPTVSQPNITYVATPTGNKPVASQAAPVSAQAQSRPTQEYNVKLKESSPLPHERMAAKLDKAPAEATQKVARTRAEFGKKLEFFSDVHKQKQAMKP